MSNFEQEIPMTNATNVQTFCRFVYVMKGVDETWLKYRFKEQPPVSETVQHKISMKLTIYV